MPSPDSPLLLALGLPLGAVLWTFMEYVLHRFAFHEAKGGNYGSREHLRHHVAAAQDAPGHPVGVEGVEAVDLLRHPEELDRQAGDCAHGERRTAAAVAVGPGQHQTGQR